MIKIKTDFRAVNRMLKGLKKELGKGKNGAKAGYVKGQPRKPGDGETSAPATMDEVALFNEFGTATIPPRPFLRNAQKKAAERGGEIVQAGLNTGLSMGAIMKNVAEGLQDLIVESIEDNIPPPNAESTVAKKGSSHTLIDTSQLRASVRRRRLSTVKKRCWEKIKNVLKPAQHRRRGADGRQRLAGFGVYQNRGCVAAVFA